MTKLPERSESPVRVIVISRDTNSNAQNAPVPYPKNFCKTTITAQNFLGGPPRGSGGMLPQKILKMKVLKLAKIAFQTALYCHVDYSK